MNETTEQIIRNTSRSLWRSAGDHYDIAVYFWLMSEKMVQENMSAQAQAQFTIQDHICLRAYYLWEAAGRHHGNAIDFWLAAEREFCDRMTASSEKFWSGFQHKCSTRDDAASSLTEQ